MDAMLAVDRYWTEIKMKSYNLEAICQGHFRVITCKKFPHIGRAPALGSSVALDLSSTSKSIFYSSAKVALSGLLALHPLHGFGAT